MRRHSTTDGTVPTPDGTNGLHFVDLDTERGLLGGIMLHPHLLTGAVTAGLAPGTFATPGHAAMFRAFLRVGAAALLQRPCGAVHDELGRAADLGLMGPNGREMVTLLLEALPPRLIPDEVERLRTLESARRVQNALREAHAALLRDPSAGGRVLAGLRGGR